MAIKFNPRFLPKLPNVIQVATFKDADALRALVIEWHHPGFPHFWAYRTDGTGVLCLLWDPPPAEPPPQGGSK